MTEVNSEHNFKSRDFMSEVVFMHFQTENPKWQLLQVIYFYYVDDKQLNLLHYISIQSLKVIFHHSHKSQISKMGKR